MSFSFSPPPSVAVQEPSSPAWACAFVQGDCGPNLEYDNAFLDLQQVATGKPETQFEPATPPDWNAVETGALTLLEKSRDLRLVQLWIESRLNLQGLSTLPQGLEAFALLLETAWLTVNPPLDEGDPYARLNVVENFGSGGSFFQSLRHCVVVRNPRIGELRLKDFEVLTGNSPGAELPVVRDQVEQFFRSPEGMAPQLRAIVQDSLTGLKRILHALGEHVEHDRLPQLQELKSLLSHLLAYLPAPSMEQTPGLSQHSSLRESTSMNDQVTVTEFVKRVAAAPSNAVTLFYYAGHGLQVESNNLLLGSGANPAAPRKDLVSRSLVLQQKLLAELPPRPQALNITVIDACRTDLRNALGDGEGLNQVEAPLGSLVCFSTGAGRLAVSPDSADQNTFYTAALVRQLREAADHITFNDLFRMVKHDVEQTMLNHPLHAIRQLTQYPFIADNLRVQVPVGWQRAEAQEKPTVVMDPQEQAAWLEIQDTAWPVDLLRRCKEFLKQYPDSTMASSVMLYQAGAAQALEVLRAKEVKLFKTSFVLPDSPAVRNEQDPVNTPMNDLSRAARGDKDAAARIARLHRTLSTQQGMLRYLGWLQFAGGLGNGIASYELALYYREHQQPLLAAQAEARARQLGYSPPRALGHYRK